MTYVDDHRDYFDLLDDSEVLDIFFKKRRRKTGNKELIEKIHVAVGECAQEVYKNLPNRIERTRAMTKLQETLFWAVAAIERDHAYRNFLQKKRLLREKARLIKKKCGGRLDDCECDF